MDLMNGRQVKCRVIQREAGSVGTCDTVWGWSGWKGGSGRIERAQRSKTNAAGRRAQSEYKVDENSGGLCREGVAGGKKKGGPPKQLTGEAWPCMYITVIYYSAVSLFTSFVSCVQSYFDPDFYLICCLQWYGVYRDILFGCSADINSETNVGVQETLRS